MPRYSLRTLIIVMLLGGPALAVIWWTRNTAFVILPISVLLVGVGYCGAEIGTAVLFVAERCISLLFGSKD